MPPTNDDPELPPELLVFAEQLMAATPADRERLLDRLGREHPGHATALSRLAADLFGIDRLLTDGYRPAVKADPATIGDCRVVRRLGEGAFGAVYLCAQSAPVRRDVAVKVLRPGAGDRRTLLRFDAERQFLARQNHPAITQVFDAGTLPDGRPYFVMEHVPGPPITDYCDRSRLPVRARVELFTQLCHGVEHAHAHGVVHRDLKPANILVVDVDGRPQPKIIDFGIAKALDPASDAEPEVKSLATETGRVVGTPGYMSPEQAAGRPDAIDARTDVFALGVLLYELLTGDLPWGRRPTTTDSEPLRPSRRVAADPTRTSTVADLRASDPRRLVSSLRGDLDWIVLKALHVDRESRYASARELGADLRRHLVNEAVEAGPPSLRYRLRKAARRHRIALVLVGTLLGAGAVTVAQKLHFDGRQIANEQTADAAVAALLARANDPAMVQTPNSAPLRQLLIQDALTFHDRQLAEQPGNHRSREARVRTLSSLSQVHYLLGQYPKAVDIARDAVADAELLIAAAPSERRYRGLLGAALRHEGVALTALGKRSEARLRLARAVELLEGCHAEDPDKWGGLLASGLDELAGTMASPAETEARKATLVRALGLREQVFAATPTDDNRRSVIATSLSRMGVAMVQGDLAAAKSALQRAEELLPALPLCPSHPATYFAASQLAALQGDSQTSIARLGEAIAAATPLSALEETRPLGTRSLSDLHAALAAQLYAVGRIDDGHAEMRHSIEAASNHVAKFPGDPLASGNLAQRASFLAYGLMASGKRSLLVEAESAARRAASALAALPTDAEPAGQQWLRWINGYRLGRILAYAGKPDTEGIWLTAAADLAAWRDRHAIAPNTAADVAEAAVWIAERHERAGEEQAAERLLSLFDETAAAFPTFNRHELRTVHALRLRARLAARRGDHALAAALAEQALTAGASWPGVVAAAESMSAAAGAVAPTDAAHERYAVRTGELWQEAAGMLEQVAQQLPDDPWAVIPLAHCRIHMAKAELAKDRREEARKLLEAALAALEPLQEEAFVDEWNEPLVHEARGMLAGL